MNRTLWAFGDSFVDGLIKIVDGKDIRNDISERREISFVNQIVERHSFFKRSWNFGAPGMGNEYIGYALQRELNKIQPQDFVLFVMSHSTRAAIFRFDRDTYMQCTAEQHAVARRHPVFQSDMVIAYAHTELKRRNIPHMIMNSFDTYSQYSSLPFDVLKSYNYYKPEYEDNTLFDIILNRGNFCTKLGSKYDVMDLDPRNNRTVPYKFVYSDNEYISECNHPSPLGHKLIADTLMPIIEDCYVQQS